MQLFKKKIVGERHVPSATNLLNFRLTCWEHFFMQETSEQLSRMLRIYIRASERGAKNFVRITIIENSCRSTLSSNELFKQTSISPGCLPLARKPRSDIRNMTCFIYRDGNYRPSGTSRGNISIMTQCLRTISALSAVHLIDI